MGYGRNERSQEDLIAAIRSTLPAEKEIHAFDDGEHTGPQVWRVVTGAHGCRAAPPRPVHIAPSLGTQQQWQHRRPAHATHGSVDPGIPPGLAGRGPCDGDALGIARRVLVGDGHRGQHGCTLELRGGGGVYGGEAVDNGV